MLSPFDALESAELNKPEIKNLEAALAYVRKGWKVFPIYGIRNGRCTCGKNDCDHPGKHPMTKSGFYDASRDEKQVKAWWNTSPDANIGIPTGSINEVLVIDVDKKNNGYENIVNAVEKYGPLNSSVVAHTGGGGMHYFYKYPIGRKIASRNGFPGPGIDIRAEGGYVVVAPSNHESGGCYTWAKGRGPFDEISLDELAKEWVNLLTSPSEAAGYKQAFVLPDVIGEGQRNQKLFEFGASLRGQGFTIRVIDEMLNKANKERCTPPLSNSEVVKIVDSLDKYPRGGTVAIFPGISKDKDYMDPSIDAGHNVPDEQTQKEEIAWNPLPANGPTLSFPVKVFPPDLQCIIEELTDSLQVSIDFVGSMVLLVLCIACLGTSVRVLPDYLEPTQLYLLLAALPSERKSAVLSFLLRAFLERARLINEFNKVAKAENELKRTMLSKRFEKALAKGDGESARIIQSEMDQLPEIKMFDTPFTDVTTEALTKAMAKNGGRGSIASAEGCLFNTLSGTYSPDPNIDIILQGWSGERVRVERIGRDPVLIDRSTLAILVAVQPQVMERFLCNEVLLERGLCARFLYCVPKSNIGHRNVREAKPVSANTYNNYAKIIQTLAQQSYDDVPRELKMDGMATELYYQWAEEVESKIGSGGEWHGIANGWEGKLVGNTIRIAGILKMADSPDCSLPINVLHFSGAIELARYFVDHAMAATGKAAGLTPAAREVLEELNKQGESPFSPYELRQKLRFRKRFKEGIEVDKALNCLADAGYIRLSIPPDWQGVGRKPEALYVMHPDLLSNNDEKKGL